MTIGGEGILLNLPSLNPIHTKLERFELFSTQQAYFIIASDKYNSAYRVLKIDRTLIIPSSIGSGSSSSGGGGSLNVDTGSIDKLQHSPVSVETPASPRSTQSEPQQQQPQSTQTQGLQHQSSSVTAQNALFNRSLSSFCIEDPHVYSQEEIQDMLDMIHSGNKHAGGLRPITKAYGIVGFIRFLDCYYLTLITKRLKVGSIGGCAIYSIKGTETFPIKPADLQNPCKSGGMVGESGNISSGTSGGDPSSMLLSLWNQGKRSVGLGLTNREIAELRYQGLYQVLDLSKNFFFSYNYDITRTLQDNFLLMNAEPFPPPQSKDMFSWNHFLTRELEQCTSSLTSSYWILPIVHGAFVQRKVIDYGRSINLILLARRSRHFAGTRYLKRGVSDQGHVANDVETEQIIHDETFSGAKGSFCSFTQVRGSIPIYWTQESSVTMPKPPIILNRIDPSYNATQLHFGDLLRRYGSPAVVVDLVKQSEKREREVIVGNEYRHAIEYLNSYIDDGHKIRYCALDYSHVSKHHGLNVSSSLNEVAVWAVNQTGFFCSSPSWKITEGEEIRSFTDEDRKEANYLSKHIGIPIFPMEQKGVLRTNCIDCLDRTNVAQFSAGVAALAQQLAVMGIRSTVKLDAGSSIVRVLIDMYVEIGDFISLQYGGSEAHKKVDTGIDLPAPLGKHKELLTSIRRYYSNAFTDRLKQDAINLFLGLYIPSKHSIPLWELESDYHLHNSHLNSSTIVALRHLKKYQFRNNETKENDLQGESSSDRLEAVKERFSFQVDSLSSWWKVSLQYYITQRMWMKLETPDDFGTDYLDSFDRIYQPEKLTQFDKYFARSWSMPSRLSHEASLVNDDLAGHRKNKTLGLTSISESSHNPSEDENETLNEVLIKSKTRVEPIKENKEISKIYGEEHPQEMFLSDLRVGQKPYDEYLKYTSSIDNLFAQFGQEPVSCSNAFKEFATYIANTDLDSDDVEGIRRLADSAHIGGIKSGLYKDIPTDVSAVEVASIIHEQLLKFSPGYSNDRIEGNNSTVDQFLTSRKLNTPSVKQFINENWKELAETEDHYRSLLDRNLKCKRSDLTDNKSFRLYASFFDCDTSISSLDKAFIDRQQVEPQKRSDKIKSTHFIQKKCTESCDNNENNLRKSSEGLSILMDLRRHVKSGFEQINDDNFAKNDNKFIVFNRKGAECWKGAEALTKLCSIHDDFTVLDPNYVKPKSSNSYSM